MAAVVALGLTACGGKETAAAWTKEQGQGIVDSGAFSDELDELDLDTAVSGVSIPWHPGAAKYFAEQGKTVG